jgi:hypothetical protein
MYYIQVGLGQSRGRSETSIYIYICIIYIYIQVALGKSSRTFTTAFSTRDGEGLSYTLISSVLFLGYLLCKHKQVCTCTVVYSCIVLCIHWRSAALRHLCDVPGAGAWWIAQSYGGPHTAAGGLRDAVSPRTARSGPAERSGSPVTRRPARCGFSEPGLSIGAAIHGRKGPAEGGGGWRASARKGERERPFKLGPRPCPDLNTHTHTHTHTHIFHIT